MSLKVFFVVCANIVLIKSVLSQYNCANNLGTPGIRSYGLPTGAYSAPGLLSSSNCGGLGNAAISGLAYGAGLPGYSTNIGGGVNPGFATNSGALQVTSTSSTPSSVPAGLSVVSENVIEGQVQVIGDLPFLGGTALEGVFSTSGAGITNHNCGNGVVAIESVSPAAVVTPAVELVSPAGYGPAISSATCSPAVSTAEVVNPAVAYGPGISSGCSPVGISPAREIASVGVGCTGRGSGIIY